MGDVDKYCGRKKQNRQFAQCRFFVEKKWPNFQKCKKSYPHWKMWKIQEKHTYQPSYPRCPHKKRKKFTVYISFFETNVLWHFDKDVKCGYVFGKNCWLLESQKMRKCDYKLSEYLESYRHFSFTVIWCRMGISKIRGENHAFKKY